MFPERFSKRTFVLASFFVLLLQQCSNKVDAIEDKSKNSDYFFRSKRSVSSNAEETYPMDETLRISILLHHNLIRGFVHPNASDMRKLFWDNELAASAQKYSEMCNVTNNLNLSLSGNIGTNVHVTPNVPSNQLDSAQVKTIIDEWKKEENNYDYETNTCKGNCNNYIQLVWSSTLKVGCGATKCKSVIGSTISPAIVFACDYSPKSSANQRPYLNGTHCSECPADVICQAKLCIEPKHADPSTQPSTTVGMKTTTTTTTKRNGTDKRSLNIFMLFIAAAFVLLKLIS